MICRTGVGMSGKPREEQNVKILQIGNYPPPVCGWAMQTKFLVEEIRRRGIVCDVLNLNENRARKSHEYIDVQNGFDYLVKLIRFAFQGYRFQVHANGQSRTGYLLALTATLIGRLAGRPVVLSWRGGLHQKYFPGFQNFWLRWPYQLLFRMSGQISCNNLQVKQAIEGYGVDPARIAAIPGFSRQHITFERAALSRDVETFLQKRSPVFFCYVSYRPEYQLPILREAMLRFRRSHPDAGFIWLGFPAKEMAAARDFVDRWSLGERESLLLLGNLTHDEFLTLLSRCFAYVRTPTCDGVSSSILEALSLGIPVVASENANRPPNVITYREGDTEDLCGKLIALTQNYSRAKQQAGLEDVQDNIARTVDWLLEESSEKTKELTQDFASAD
jgi:glycosyltransferase involved in cell wall biosynthesis